MKYLEIVKWPDERLKTPSEPVYSFELDEMRRLADEMAKIMVRERGKGLAAVQVGVHKRLILVEDDRGVIHAFLNPQIIWASNEVEEEEEGCLSFPNLFLPVERPVAVEVQAMDLSGKEIFLRAEGFDARAFCHEIDHLDGIVFIDRVSDKWSEKKEKLLRLYLDGKLEEYLRSEGSV